MQNARRTIQVVIGASVALLVAWGAWSTLSTTRVLTVDELQAGMDFVLVGVRFRQIGYNVSDFPDGGAIVTFEIEFPDGAHEVVRFGVRYFGLAGSVAEIRTMHSNPGALFRYVCCGDTVLVRVI